jgi:hypothetical protein
VTAPSNILVTVLPLDKNVTGPQCSARIKIVQSSALCWCTLPGPGSFGFIKQLKAPWLRSSHIRGRQPGVRVCVGSRLAPRTWTYGKISRWRGQDLPVRLRSTRRTDGGCGRTETCRGRLASIGQSSGHSVTVGLREPSCRGHWATQFARADYNSDRRPNLGPSPSIEGSRNFEGRTPR